MSPVNLPRATPETPDPDLRLDRSRICNGRDIWIDLSWGETLFFFSPTNCVLWRFLMSWRFLHAARSSQKPPLPATRVLVHILLIFKLQSLWGLVDL
jgi:hypothetical protein